MKIFVSLFICCFSVSIISSGQPARPAKLKRSDCFFGVHFDLHASEDISDAGKTLTYQMIDTFLTVVKPDFIQIDCKGHPGISSYPTEVGYHVKGFDKDPLKLFREVTEKNNVGLYMHFSGVWDSKVASEHPDWAVIRPNGEKSNQKVSFFSPYLDTYMIPQLKELAGKYKVDGAWIDGECWAVEPDYSGTAVKEFTEKTGITEIPYKRTDKYFPEYLDFTRSLFRAHLIKYVNAIHEFRPDFQITSNWAYSSLMPEKVIVNVDYLSGDVTPQNGVYRSAFEARCLAPQGKPWDLMAWGFSWNGGDMPMSIKSAVQLKQEAAEIIAMGGGVQFYFQQNRDLSIKPWIADMLEDIGTFCRQRQAYVHKATPLPQIALLYPSESFFKKWTVPYSGSTGSLQGALYALLDGQQAVEIRAEHNLTGRMKEYPVIIIPECDYLSPSFIEELKLYVSGGGNLIIFGPEAALLFSEPLGLLSPEKRNSKEAFFEAAGRIGSIRSDFLHGTIKPDVRVLSYFYSGSDFRYIESLPAATVRKYGKGNVAAIWFNAGSSYASSKTFVIRDLVNGVVNALFPEKAVTISGSGLAHLAVNSLNNKMYINIINASGDHSGQNTIGYDELLSLPELRVTVKYPVKPSSVVLQPGNSRLKYMYSDGNIIFSVPPTEIHSIIEIF